MLDTGLKGKTVLITGANNPKGIGAATGRAFAAQGASVFVTYQRQASAYPAAELAAARASRVSGDTYYRALQQEPADQLLEDLRAAGAQAEAWEVDLAQADACGELFDRCEAAFGAIDVLVNNHAHCVLDTFDPLAPSEAGEGKAQLISRSLVDDHYAINTRASVLLMTEFVRRHYERDAFWGRIINVTSGASDCHPNHASYVASKHAVESYSRTAACEVGRYGITVNVVAPGPTQTGYIDCAMSEAITKRIPMGRVGEPEDVADLVVFLASDQARWLTGQLIYAGGGWDMPR